MRAKKERRFTDPSPLIPEDGLLGAHGWSHMSAPLTTSNIPEHPLEPHSASEMMSAHGWSSMQPTQNEQHSANTTGKTFEV